MGKHYSEEFKNQVLKDYLEGTYGGRINLSRHYGISEYTIKDWIKKYRKQGNLCNDINKKRGKRKESEINYKERYEILKNYQAFIKAQREKK